MSLGRPKKNQTLTTLTTEVAEPVGMITDDQSYLTEAEPLAFTAEPKESPEELKFVALSVIRNPLTQKWALLKTNFDFVTNTFGKIEIIEENTERENILHRYKILTGDYFMGAS